ncbi:MAG: hypothetical protein EB103_01750 [Actinobacteria bacterium]|nr:hypothetical protein [Actinomycetota bacterium]
MTNPWQEWKKKNLERQQSGVVSPVDFLNPDTQYCSDDAALERFDICLKCEFLSAVSHQCQQCGCFMKLKTRLANASCPIGKWGTEPSE